MGRVAIMAGVGAIAVAASLVAVAGLSSPSGSASGMAPTPVAAFHGGDAGRGEGVFRACSACHTIGRQGADVDGPNLYGVVGARIAGRRPRYGYTQSLRDLGGVWTEARLDAWLTDPAALAPGTAMHFAGLPQAGDRADVIAYLAAHGPAR